MIHQELKIIEKRYQAKITLLRILKFRVRLTREARRYQRLLVKQSQPKNLRWINMQRNSEPEVDMEAKEERIPDLYPCYRDSEKLEFGCKHYKRNCKLVASCCNKSYTCRHCHDEATDHVMDRKATTMMICMKCLIIQPIGPTCSTVSCNSLSMARYYCSICKLFDDERQIYHCPHCDLCRIGEGLGIDFFHCMNCNACMSKSLSKHICREKCLEVDCPICHEYIFTSSTPLRALSCGHIMHSSCFDAYTSSNYTCPICCKSLGDMQVYFGMIDAMLAEETIPEEYVGQTQDILCNDFVVPTTPALSELDIIHLCD
ncbi:unnamed protein product [Lactuca saligna]|uniref:Uncharacterized protein n=1 Tax=Lactuca saligna TaxID=75948 RepID=A0AA36E452_LACSI|nr:unnamed protein product [Lactuca saligna]